MEKGAAFFLQLSASSPQPQPLFISHLAVGDSVLRVLSDLARKREAVDPWLGLSSKIALVAVVLWGLQPLLITWSHILGIAIISHSSGMSHHDVGAYLLHSDHVQD